MGIGTRTRRPTIRDVALAAGVSGATVSYVLNDLGKVTPEVDALVRRVAGELGYRRNRVAAALRSGRGHAIGCIVPSLASPVFPEIARAVQRRAEEHGLATFVIDSGDGEEREEQAARILSGHGIVGAVAVLSARSRIIEPPPFPLVVMDRACPGLDSVRADHAAGGRRMAEHLASLGHRRIGLLSGEQEFESSLLRRDGFLAAAEGCLEIVWEVAVPLSATLAPDAVASLARRDVTAVACVNDLVAIAALSALRETGIAVPAEASVIGFDDTHVSSWPIVDLTTVRQPLAELGAQAVDLLLRRIDDPTASVEDIVLPVTLVQRGSTAPPSRRAGSPEEPEAGSSLPLRQD